MSVYQIPQVQVRSSPVRLVLDNPWFQRLLIWSALAIAWELFGRRVGPFFFAPFTKTMAGLGQLAASGDLWELAHSIRQMLAGYFLAAAVGIPLGLLMGAFHKFAHVVEPYANLLFVTSIEALLPFLIILFGVGFEFLMTVVFLFSVLYIVFNVQAGVRNVDPALVETARSFGASPARIFKDVVLPGSLPYVVAGLRLGLGMAVKGMVIAELWVHTGTGAILFGLAQYRQLDRFLALTLVIVVLGAVSVQALYWLQKRLAPWAPDVTAGR